MLCLTQDDCPLKVHTLFLTLCRLQKPFCVVFRAVLEVKKSDLVLTRCT